MGKVMIEVEAKLCLACTMVWNGLNGGKSHDGSGNQIVPGRMMVWYGMGCAVIIPDVFEY